LVGFKEIVRKLSDETKMSKVEMGIIE